MPEPLGPLQLQVMELVWEMAPTTVPQVHEALARRRKIAYTTVLTTMRSLERRGMVRHDAAGKAYVYEPALSRKKYTASCLGRLVDELFDGKKEKLLCHLLGAERIGAKELAEIRRMLAGRRDKESRS